jgi:DNA-binding transcriptional ArsR family regulator
MPAATAKDYDALSAAFAALADPTRRGIVERLSRGPAAVGELARPLDMSWPAVTKHLRVLESAGFIQRHHAGRHRVLELNPEPMSRARAWMDHHREFWEKNLDSLADYLERGITKSPQPEKKCTSVKRPAKPKRPKP